MKTASRYQRQRVWRHNSFLGTAAMAYKGIGNMIDADSLTPEARELAIRIAQDCYALQQLLKVRVDPDKTPQLSLPL